MNTKLIGKLVHLRSGRAIKLGSLRAIMAKMHSGAQTSRYAASDAAHALSQTGKDIGHTWNRFNKTLAGEVTKRVGFRVFEQEPIRSAVEGATRTGPLTVNQLKESVLGSKGLRGKLARNIEKMRQKTLSVNAPVIPIIGGVAGTLLRETTHAVGNLAQDAFRAHVETSGKIRNTSMIVSGAKAVLRENVPPGGVKLPSKLQNSLNKLRKGISEATDGKHFDTEDFTDMLLRASEAEAKARLAKDAGKLVDVTNFNKEAKRLRDTAERIKRQGGYDVDLTHYGAIAGVSAYTGYKGLKEFAKNWRAARQEREELNLQRALYDIEYARIRREQPGRLEYDYQTLAKDRVARHLLSREEAQKRISRKLLEDQQRRDAMMERDQRRREMIRERLQTRSARKRARKSSNKKSRRG